MRKPLSLDLRLNRSAWRSILIAAGLLSLAIAATLERFGISLGHTSPFAFTCTVVAAKLALFALWPSLTRWKSTSSHDVIGGIFNKPAVSKKTENLGSITLWDESSSRLASALFTTNLPTFILSSDQRLLDWNSAFALVFADEAALKRGAPLTAWYSLLDNFRRVPARDAKLHGAGILPLADRERAVYLSPKFGRMVFTKVMAPLIDLASGRIVGWSVVLNVNSVHRRQDFFAALYSTIAAETRRVRFAAAYDRLFDQFSGRRELLEKHVQALSGARRILDVGCGTGAVSAALLAEGHRVTAVDGDPHLLRQARQRCAAFVNAKLVRKPLAELTALPQQRYDGAVLCYHLQTEADPQALLQRLNGALKPGGLLVVTLRADGSNSDMLYAAVAEQLAHKPGLIDLNYQLEHVRSGAAAAAAERSALPPVDVATALAQLEASGFSVFEEWHGLEDGQSLMLIARKC